ncbi:hypothetical protein P7D52_08160 [Enterococcus dongliensis]|uniref:Uncharacterized protein n=1 Tax=Enterococcus dongliensis TaxID=2559925 RepID=A0AAW8TPG3_9ENTE|nr:hypothetical protein [Enterococcus dongliensis]MDT2635878.1 hypothetical protein [Enterococcus dongliensis]MDT2637621.1 hypothetical protein [Enterococcus dongliensis]MDT2642759.1 hypothetical protein [Enterococcus dongliensis]
MKLNIEFTEFEDSFATDDEELLLPISGVFYLEEDSHLDYRKWPRIYIEIYSLNHIGAYYLARTTFLLNEEARGNLISFEKEFSFAKQILKEENLTEIVVRFSVADKPEGEMGLGAQIEANTFHISRFPISLFDGGKNE